MNLKLTLTEKQHRTLYAHLFPEEKCESVAFLLCGRHEFENSHRLFVHKVFPVPYHVCSNRSPVSVTWPTDYIQPILDEAARENLAVVKIHGHLLYDKFSAADDESDRTFFPQVYCWTDNEYPHASMFMLSDQRYIGRYVSPDGKFETMKSIMVVGDEIKFWSLTDHTEIPNTKSGNSHLQLFGEKTFKILKTLKIGVVGCSGTGSIVIEQLARLGVGELVLVDPDKIEERNLNRIVNSRYEDSVTRSPKVLSLKNAVERMGTGTRVSAIESNLFDRNAINQIADCDVVFGCMDSVDGRHLLNRIATFFLLPFFDIGVKIIADGNGGVTQISGTVHYLQPGLSTLLSRGVYSIKEYESAILLRNDPIEYKKRLESKYIEGIAGNKPAVISLNMFFASLCINEFLARIHSFRIAENNLNAVTRYCFINSLFLNESEAEQLQENIFAKYVGRGEIAPLLNMPTFS